MWFRILTTKEYREWFKQERPKSQAQIEKRLANIETAGHFGNHKQVSEYVWELKWDNGRRIYYAYIEEANLLLLLGGNKNGQSKDIHKAKKILERNTTS